MAATATLAPHRNRWVRILGVAFVMYVLSYIDRTNIAMAKQLMEAAGHGKGFSITLTNRAHRRDSRARASANPERRIARPRGRNCNPAPGIAV